MKLTELLSQRNEDNREADFSHMPVETIQEFIELRMKDTLTKEERARLTKIEGNIRYKPSDRRTYVAKTPRGANEPDEDYVNRIVNN